MMDFVLLKSFSFFAFRFWRRDLRIVLKSKTSKDDEYWVFLHLNHVTNPHLPLKLASISKVCKANSHLVQKRVCILAELKFINFVKLILTNK